MNTEPDTNQQAMLRLECLRLAPRSMVEDTTAEQMVKAAEKLYQFLIGAPTEPPPRP